MSDFKAKPRVYVAGPISIGDTLAHIANGIRVSERLLQLGFTPFCPHSMSAWWHVLHPKQHHEWLDFDFQWLDACDAMFRIPGESRGADAEEAFARGRGIPVFHDIDSLVAHFAGELAHA